LPLSQKNLLELDALVSEASRLWAFQARPEQLPPPGDWTDWLVMGGRGGGKTRTGGEWIRSCIESGIYRRVACIAPTTGDVRGVMVEGPSGLMSLRWRPQFRPDYQPSRRRIVCANGAIIELYSADEPRRLEGPQWEAAWADEIRNWRYAQRAWDSLRFGLRLGSKVRMVITSTPSASSKIILDLLKRSKQGGETAVVTRMSTYDNLANLAPDFREVILRRYEGTRKGRQELGGEMLEDVEGALWTRKLLDDTRIDEAPVDMGRIVVAVDPAASATQDSDETGIVVYGKRDGDCYFLDDLSGTYSPDGWGCKVVGAYHKWGADCIIGEANNGGDMVEHVIRTVDPSVKYKKVWASRGKIIRAEPAAALMEQGRDHHVGEFAECEDQLCTFDGTGKSPDRLDAKVWAITELMLGEMKAPLWGAAL